MDYQEILEKIVNGELAEYKVEPQTIPFTNIQSLIKSVRAWARRYW